MTVIESQPAEPRARRRGFRVGRRAWLVVAVLGFAGVGLASWVVRELWETGYFLPWTAEYDRAVYARVRRAIEADPRHEGGRPFEEVSRELGLDEVPWDDIAFQQEPGMYRMYHYRGFALHVMLRRLPAGVTPATPIPWSATDADREHSVLWLLHTYSFVRVDDLDRKERMRRYWKVLQDECDRINAEMERHRQAAASAEAEQP